MSKTKICFKGNDCSDAIKGMKEITSSTMIHCCKTDLCNKSYKLTTSKIINIISITMSLFLIKLLY
jgi:hypothetical protein